MRYKSSSLRHAGAILALLLVASSFLGILNVGVASAAPSLSLKWTAQPAQTGTATYLGAQAADLRPDIPGLEVVVTGATPPIEPANRNGAITCLNGQTGAVIWRVNRVSETLGAYDFQGFNHSPFEIVDLDKDGTYEIVVAGWKRTIALNGETGSTYWNVTVPSYDCWPAIADVNGDGYPEVFVSSGYGPYEGTDYLTELNGRTGQIIAQTTSWHPCWGGLAIADANSDGRFEIYQGDRSSDYNPADDEYSGGGKGLRVLDAITLQPIWARTDILCSSHIPMLADVDKDGILDVIAADQNNNGIAVLKASDGSVVTTGGKNRFGGVGIEMHSQPTIFDIDYDGNLEFISGQNTNAAIWDLYDWKLDATLPMTSNDPPKVGDINNDGKMEIIVPFDNVIRSYAVSVNQTNPNHNDIVTSVDAAFDSALTDLNSFTLLQDVDADNLYELILTSMSGRVYCYNTPTVASTPRPNSAVPFYSGHRLGAAEYVAPDQFKYALTVNVVGSGQVTKNPNQPSYLPGTVVTLTATPDSGATFIGWSGDLSGSTTPTTITMSSIKTVTATFTKIDHDDVVFDSDFDMGNLKNVAYVSGTTSTRVYEAENEYTIGNDPNRSPTTNSDKHWWFYFSMDNVAGKTVTITIENGTAADYANSDTSGNRWTQIEPVYSYDNITWERVPLSGVSFDRTARTFTIQIAIPAGQSKVWLAPMPPYNIGKRDALFTEFASSPYLTVTSLGTTPGGQQMKVATITDPAYSNTGKFKSYVIAQQHPGEVPGSWNADGLIRFLLSNDPTAVAIRRSYIFRIIPIVNVDSVFQGISRYTPVRADGYQYDLNRDWVNRRTPEIQMIWADLLAFQPDSFNDLHSTINTEVTNEKQLLTYSWSTSDPELLAFRASIRAGGFPETVTGTTGSTYACPVVHTNLGIDESVSWENPHDEISTNPGVKLTVSDWRAWGAAWAKGNYLYFGDAMGTLTTSVVGSGTVTKNPNQASYVFGSNVTLTAVPAGGFTFTGWSGDLTGTTNPVNITITANKTVTATFSVLGKNTLTVNPSVGNGHVDLSPAGGVYDPGTVVQLTAVPDAGWGFVQWSGDLTGSTNPTTITMNANKAVTATFADLTPLTINTAFESASIGSYTINGNQIDLTILGEPVINTPGTTYTYWTYFKVNNVQGEAVTFRITNAADIDFLTRTTDPTQLVYSYDGVNWLRFPSGSFSAGVYTFSTTFNGGNDVYVATFFPFTYTKMSDYINSIDPSPYVETSLLGLSEQGRQIKLVKLTNPAISEASKQTIYIIGRQHAAETCSSYMIQGLIDFLLSDDPVAQRSRDAFVYYIVPMLNPDGVVLGKSRVTSENRDPNRDWASTDSVEVNIVKASIDTVDASNGIDFFLDWHNQMDDLSWYNWIYSTPGNTFFPILSLWTDFDSQTSPGAGSTSARGYVTNVIQPGFMATVEPSPHLFTWTTSSLQVQGMNVAKAIEDYYDPVSVLYLEDSTFDASADSADLVANGVGQDWFESRGTMPSALTLDTFNVAGNAGKKAAIKTYSETGSTSVYLTQNLSSPQTGSFSFSFDINIDQIFADSQKINRTGYVFLGDALDATTANAGGARRFLQLAFWDNTPGTSGNDLVLVAREYNNPTTLPSPAYNQPWLDAATWTLVKSGLSYDAWINVRIDVNFATGTYDVYVNGVLAKAGINRYEQYTSASITFLSFAAGGVSTSGFGRGDFYVDNVYTPAATQYTLTVSQSGSGSVTKNPDKATYNSGETVQLAVTAAPGWVFSGWSGALSGSLNPATVTMDGPKAVTATFTQIDYILTVTSYGSGSISKSPDQATYHYGDVVSLTAIPVGGSSFSGWSGDLSGVNNPETLTITGNKDVFATFVPVSNADPVVNYVHVWGYPGGLLDPAGSIKTGESIRIFSGVSDAETVSSGLTVHISYKAQSDLSWTGPILASWEPLYGGYWYYDWSIPSGASAGLYDVKIEASDPDGGVATPVTGTSMFTVVKANNNPVVNYVHVWGYPGGLLDPAGSINSGEMVRIFAGVFDAETSSDQLSVTIKYKAQADSTWTSVSASWLSLYGGYWYYDWVVPGGISSGLYDVAVEVSDGDGGSVSVTEVGEFSVVSFNTDPVVWYVHVWGYPGGLLDPAGSINSGEAVRIFAGVWDAETSSNQLAVTIKYKAQADSVWTSVSASWESLYGGYWYYDWVIPGGASSGLYDVAVEVSDGDGGSASVTEYGEFTVVGEVEYALTVTVVPLAGGSVSADLPGPYHLNDVVTLTPSANPGYSFSGWSGDGVAGVGATWVVTMTGAKSVTATFTQLLLVDPGFDLSADSAELRANSTSQDWYESRLSTITTSLTLDETNIAGNTGKKAALKTYSYTGADSVYLTQEFASPQIGTLSVSCDINIDQIFADSQGINRTGYIFLGDALGTTTPNAGGARRFVQLAFWDSTPGTDGDMILVAREENNNDGTPPHDPWLEPATWNQVATGLSYDTWYNIRIDVHFAAGTRGSYDVYVNGVLAKAGIIGYEQYVSASITHISFATGGVSTSGFGRGDFYVDNVQAVLV